MNCSSLTRLTLFFALLLVGFSGSGTSVRSQEPDALSASDVQAVLAAAASAINDPTFAAAVVDRRGVILGVYARPGASRFSWDAAVTIARTAGFFSNGQAPLSTRTVRFISGIHFPPGVPNTPNAALYGIETTNRGCQLTADNQPFDWPRSKSIAGSGLAGSPELPCNPSDTRGCAIGGPISGAGASTQNVGINTGKRDFLDIGDPLSVSVNPSGFALYRRGVVIGAVGVAGVSPERAEFAAIVGAAGTQATTGIFATPFEPIPTPGAVFIDGIRLPFFSDCTSVQCVRDRIEDGPPGGGSGSVSASDFVVPPRAGGVAREGYLIRRDNPASQLTQAEVERIIDQAVATANRTRAQVRLPLGQTAKMIIVVTDEFGEIRAHFRMPDALADAVDVVPAKARNAYYFSTREGYEVLRRYATSSRFGYEWEPEPPPGQGWAITGRTLGFGGNPLFPPGIDLEEAPTPGPWFDLFLYDAANPCTEGDGPSRGGNRAFLNQNGMVWFPGSTPLYKNGRLVGGLGVSGDGIDQNDYVTAGGAAGFEPPDELRVDRTFIVTEDGRRVRLPFWKFPRNPELP
jgi:uncharacterized protein GlcG (DUF336 family)